MRKLITFLTNFLLAQCLLFTNILSTSASNLIYCRNSEVLLKRESNSVKKIEKKLEQYPENSKIQQRLQFEILRTRQKFDSLVKSNTLCGQDGVPRIVFNKKTAYNFAILTLLFIYIAGWIGWVGRKYLKYSSISENKFEKEILIDFPVFFSIMSSGYLWPIETWQEFMNNEFLTEEKNM